MPPRLDEFKNKPEFWQGFEEYLDSDSFRQLMRDEFPEHAAEWIDPLTRRRFVQLMGASLALAGAGCYNHPSFKPAPQRKIIPYIEQPDQINPGVPLFFATAFPHAGYSIGVLVRSNEGRPTKIEGNPSHPSSLGGSDVFAQASILEMYDPDRSQLVRRNSVEIGYETVMSELRSHFFDENDQPRTNLRLRILTETVTSPTLADQIESLLKQYPQSRWAKYEVVGSNRRDGIRLAFGEDREVIYDYTKADVVLALDSDFLSDGPGHLRYSRDFASRRRVRQNEKDGIKPEQMNRLYAVECMPTTTGSTADHRLPLLSSQIEGFARELARQLGVPGVPTDGAKLPDHAKAWIGPLANDLAAHRGRVIVTVGETQPPSLHALAYAINAHLGSLGPGKPVQVIESVPAPTSQYARGKVIDLKTLVAEMERGEVDLLVIFDVNVAYTAPSDIPFTAALSKVKTTLHLGLYFDETAARCTYHIPQAHYLETWGDGRGHDGTAAIQQPLIAPLYKGKSPIELIAELTKAPVRDGYSIVRSFWRRRLEADMKGDEFDSIWHQALREGVMPGTEARVLDVTNVNEGWAQKLGPLPSPPANGELEINFRLDPTLFDGRYANNGWLQELPKPVSKLTWDNAVYISPRTAEELKITHYPRWTAGERGRYEVSVVELDYRGRKVLAPVWVLPGHPDRSVTIHLGSGRERAGRVVNGVVGNNNVEGLTFGLIRTEKNAEGKATRGFNANTLRTADKSWFDNGLKISPTSGTYYLACVQGNYRMTEIDPISGKELDRKPVRRGTLDEYQKNPSFGKIPPTAVSETELINENVPGSQPHPQHGHDSKHGHEHTHANDGKDGHAKNGHGRLHPLTMYNDNETLAPDLPAKQLRKWAMAIDLTTCTGCNACEIACVAENNIPVVGKHEVTRGHEMHWIRIDRYYSGDPHDPEHLETYFQPVPCQQCEKAPCEVVCPVGATVHSTDGLNDMVYNRCVGTRYCANNCPYKVRRFNFLTFADWATESLKLGRNPEVTVRSRGVMEKCTYCVQRIRTAEIAAEREGRPIRDGEVVTACQAACPTGSIMFGDMADSQSAILRWKQEPATYGLLAELNTMPRTTYLSCIRNPNPNMPQPKGTSSAH